MTPRSRQLLDEDNNDNSGECNELINEEDDVELDFHIQFPSPGYANDEAVVEKVDGDSDKETGEEESNNLLKKPQKIWPIAGGDGDKQDEKEVLVVLLGWAGSQHKNLAKYSDIYLKRGCIVLRYIAPVKALFVQTSKLPILTSKLIRLITDLQLESHPIFFHVFSNGGSFTYSSALMEIYKMQDKLKLDIRGTIFDSAPTPRNIGKCFHAVKNIFENLGVVRYAIASFVVLMIILQVFWHHISSAAQLVWFGEQFDKVDPVKYDVRESPMTNWLSRICRVKNHNFLFMYSDKDDLIPCDQVEEVAAIAEANGNFVVKKKFLGSLHVQHYRKYPKEYVDEVTEFIRHSMKTKKLPTIYWDGV